MASNTEQLQLAVQLALKGDWHMSHLIAQDYSDPVSNWIHAVLHKIEGDTWNSKYWYARTAGKRYEEFTDANDELNAIASTLLQSLPK